MKKLLIFIFLFLLSGINNNVFSVRYNNHQVIYNPPGTTACNDDADGVNDSGYNKVATNNSSTSTVPEPSVFDVPDNGIMNCLYRDNENPVGTVSYSPNTWTNGDVTVSIICDDVGGSLCDMSYANSGWSVVGNVYSRVFTSNTTGNITIRDNVGFTTIIAYNVNNIDKTVPNGSDITSGTSSDLLATDNQNLQINVDEAGGSPISRIEGYFEDYSKCDDSLLLIDTSNNNLLSVNKNISEVKPGCDFDNPKGGREYTFSITKVEDEAGNVYNGPKDFIYSVYSNTSNLGTNEFNNTQVSLLEGGSKIADGSSQDLSLTLNDNWNNPIIQSPGISREIDFNFNVTNSLYLDQHLRTGDGIYLTIPNNTTNYNNRLTSNSSFDNQVSTDGIYDFSFKVYTPTRNAYDKAFGEFTINDVTFDSNGTLGNVANQLIGNSTISFNYLPIYETLVNGDLKDVGYYEGATQTGSIEVLKNGTTITSSNNLYVEFGSGTSNTLSAGLSMYTNLNDGDEYVGEGNNSFISATNLFKNSLSVGSNLLYTILNLDGGLLEDINDAYFSTHVSYTLDGKDIVYNGDIIGKDNYWDTTLTNNTSLLGVKIIGKSHSQDQLDLTANQDETDIHTLGNLKKNVLQKDMRKTVFDITKNINYSPVASPKISYLNNSTLTGNDGMLLTDTLIYNGDMNGGIVELDLLDTGKNITGKKTILIVGGDLYIKSNIINSAESDILGIIVLKNSTGDGGNVYVDPSVTKMDSVMYADKSLISYDGTSELDGTTSQYVLRNQLYIYGSLFSENTIGGSRGNPPICPYYVTGTCDLFTAQKYDLNYVRRYFIVGGAPFNSGVNYYGVYDASYDYYEYPVVIKYNPSIQISPPPLFED